MHGGLLQPKNRDVSAGPLACPLARSLAPLTHWLAPYCSLRSRAPLRSLVRSVARSLTRSQARGTVKIVMSQFQAALNHSTVVE